MYTDCRCLYIHNTVSYLPGTCILLLFTFSITNTEIYILHIVTSYLHKYHCMIPITSPEDELSSVERQLDGDGILGGEDVQGGVVWRRRRGDTEKVRKLAKQLSHDVELLKKEKEEYSL